MSFDSTYRVLLECGVPAAGVFDQPVTVWTLGEHEALHTSPDCTASDGASEVTLTVAQAASEPNRLCRDCTRTQLHDPLLELLHRLSVRILAFHTGHRLATALARDEPTRDPAGFLRAMSDLYGPIRDARNLLAELTSETHLPGLLRQMLEADVRTSETVLAHARERVLTHADVLGSTLGIDLSGPLHWVWLPRPWYTVSSVADSLEAKLAVTVYAGGRDPHPAKDTGMVVAVPSGLVSGFTHPAARWSSSGRATDLGAADEPRPDQVAETATALLLQAPPTSDAARHLELVRTALASARCVLAAA